MDNPDAALIDFEQAKILEADHPMESTDQHGFFHAGLAYFYHGESKIALEYLQRALYICHQNHDELMATIVQDLCRSIGEDVS